MRDETTNALAAASEVVNNDDDVSLLDLALPLVENRWLLILGPLIAGALAFGATFLVAPTFTARTSFLPPQQQQSAAASALASLGPLAGLAGINANLKTPADQYAGLMQSTTVEDRLVDGFKLMEVYGEKLRVDTRKELEKNVRISVGKKDGLITVEFDDRDPKRAADVANRYVDELRRLTSQLALTEAQQRRVFFEDQLKQTGGRLADAQRALQASGFNQGALKAEPKAAAESYARLKAEATSAEVRLHTLRRTLAETTPEVQQQSASLSALRAQLSKAEQSTDLAGGADYVSKYREFKYQETLFDLFARQYEMARLDESREGTLIQVVDVATPPERKSRPKRATIALATAVLVGLALIVFVLVRNSWRRSADDLSSAEQMTQLRRSLRKT